MFVNATTLKGCLFVVFFKSERIRKLNLLVYIRMMTGRTDLDKWKKIFKIIVENYRWKYIQNYHWKLINLLKDKRFNLIQLLFIFTDLFSNLVGPNDTYASFLIIISFFV